MKAPAWHILVVDDEPNIRKLLKGVLEDEGYGVSAAADAREADAELDRGNVDLVLLDIQLPGEDGLGLLRRWQAEDVRVPVIVMSGHGTIRTAVEATRAGALDFIEKPIQAERLLMSLANALQLGRLKTENVDLRRDLAASAEIIGSSPAILQLRETIQRAAATDARVLITGENGTGKEVVARRIHEMSARSSGPFVAVNCAAIPQTLIEAELFGYEKGAFTGAVKSKRGKFELAHGGTILLDEIADMSLEAQSKVLRVLEEMQFERVGGVNSIKVDVRVIAATNKDLAVEIKEGRFREDLYYRLNVVPIKVPALRERREDIPALIEYYLDYFAQEYNKKRKGISPEAMRYLTESYPWPGNIRELKNLIERINILSTADPVSLKDVKNNIAHFEEPFTFDESKSLKESVEDFQRSVIASALHRNGNNIMRTAEQLKVERSNLYKLMRRLGLQSKK